MRYILATVTDLAECIAGQINTERVLSKKFPSCDFAMVDVDKADVDADKVFDLAEHADGWYGIKRVSTGFDSYNLCLVSDYYGGGCASFRQLFDGIDRREAVEAIRDMILETIRFQEEAYENTMLIADFGEDQKEEPQNEKFA